MANEGLSKLTERERACLRLLWAHLGAKEIATRLDLTPATVETYIKRATVKLGLSRRIDAARLVAEAECLDAVASPDQGSPIPGLVSAHQPTADTGSAGDTEPRSNRVREEGVPFAALSDSSLAINPASPTDGAGDHHVLDGWARVRRSLAYTIALALIVVLLASAMRQFTQMATGQ